MKTVKQKKGLSDKELIEKYENGAIQLADKLKKIINNAPIVKK